MTTDKGAFGDRATWKPGDLDMSQGPASSGGRLSAIIDRLTAGKLTTAEAAEKLRGMRKFPPAPPAPTVHAVLGGSDDPYGDDQEDDGHELTQARSDKRITPEQYATLYAALHEARAAAGR